MGHEINDLIGLRLGERIASELPSRPEWIELARENLRRWSTLHAGTPSRLPGHAEWLRILDGPVEAVVEVLTERSDRGQRLRQNSPFAGALSPREVWEIKQRCRDESTAA
jgi:hypothetical protein